LRWQFRFDFGPIFDFELDFDRYFFYACRYETEKIGKTGKVEAADWRPGRKWNR
jgi:hypothetical protein